MHTRGKSVELFCDVTDTDVRIIQKKLTVECEMWDSHEISALCSKLFSFLNSLLFELFWKFNRRCFYWDCRHVENVILGYDCKKKRMNDSEIPIMREIWGIARLPVRREQRERILMILIIIILIILKIIITNADATGDFRSCNGKKWWWKKKDEINKKQRYEMKYTKTPRP